MLKLSYYPDTDTLYMDFSDTVSTESLEVYHNVVFDFDQNRRIIGISIDNASHVIDIEKLRPELEICTEPAEKKRSA
jgi:uncharacterized protein YuzE